MKRTLIAVLIALSSMYSVNSPAQQKKAPNFTLKSDAGKTYKLSDYRGKIVVVNFWATWCGPCREEIPDFIDLYKKYRSKGLQIIGVSVDQDGWDAVKPYVKEAKINYPVVLGNEKVVAAYGNFEAIPTTFIVDRKGNVVDQQTGMMSKEQLLARIEPLLQKRK